MKKALQLLAAAALMMASHGNAMAYDGTVTAPSGQTLYYEYVDSTGSVTIVRPGSSGWGTETQPTEVLVIPDSVLHLGTMYPVTAIGRSAFEQCQGLTAVTFPQGVTTIGNYAFRNCDGLVDLTIPDGVTEIGYRAFGGIRHIVYHGSATWASYDPYWGAASLNGVVDGDFVFADSTLTTLTGYLGTATNVTIPATVDTIGPSVFKGLNTLSSITFPEGLVSIGDETFYECYNLTSLTLPDSLREIGAQAFYNCINLTNVSIPDSVTAIGNNAFYLFRHIEYYGNATYADDNLYWGAFSINGVRDGDFLYSDSTQTKLTCYLGHGPHVAIPSSVVTIGQGAFATCEGVTSITIPDGVTTIDYGAFIYCVDLPSLTLPASVATIGNEAFWGCYELTTVTIPDGVTSIGEEAFGFCNSLTSVNLPEGLTAIEFGTFIECHALPAITIPASVTEIGGMAFCSCSSLMDVYAMSDTAPALAGLAFVMIHDSAVVHIPCGSLESYSNAWSRYFDDFSEELMYTLTVLSSDETMGSVAVLTEPDCQQAAVVQATTASGYVFEGWSISPGYQNLVTDNPLTLSVTEDMTLVAHFAPDGVGISSVADDSPVIIRVADGRIIIEGAENEPVQLFDMTGHQLSTANCQLSTGIYFVKVGSRPAQKIVVMK